MSNFVLYSNTTDGLEIDWPEDFEGFRFGIYSKSRVSSVIGSQIWFITGYGSPKQFELSYSFTADRIEPREDGLPGYRVSGAVGLPFIPPIILNDLPWFPELRRTQFWSLGLFELKSPEVVDGLIDLLRVFEDGVDEEEDDTLLYHEDVIADLDSRVADSAALSSLERRERLATAPRIPDQFEVVAKVYDRNPDVIAEVLIRAKGICEKCRRPAPFIRKSDGTPYLEVHHWTPLSEGGEDTVANAGALCPNCHREAHFG